MSFQFFRRIGLYVLRNWGGQYPDLVEKAYFSYRDKPIIAGQSEFQIFLEIQFGNLPEFAQNEILEGINKGPDPQWVDSLLEQYPNEYAGETAAEKRRTLIETWQLRELDRIAIYLNKPEKELYERLQRKYGKPSPRPEEGVVVSWEGPGPESPINLDELKEKSTDDVVQFLLDYVPSSKGFFGESSREGLGRTLEADVQARAKVYAQNALLFTNDNLPFVYHTHYLRGLENAIKNKERFAPSGVIELM